MSHRIRSMLAYCFLALLLLSGPPGGLARSTAAADSPRVGPLEDKVPPPLQGGAWDDDFLGWDSLACPDTVDVREGFLYLKFAEMLDWKQTWTAHFATGTFYHTVAISDSVQLARVPATEEYYATGVYTSTVFDAGRPVDWAWAHWNYTGLPQGVAVEWRTGNTPHPDAGWSAWIPPAWGAPESYCVVGTSLQATECWSHLAGVPNARYAQYRGAFDTDDSRHTVALWDITITYGLHYPEGTAVSIPLSPVDLRAWQTVVYSATIPSGATLQVDILDGTGDCDAPMLLAQVQPGESLEAIDPAQFRSLRLRATLRTTDPSLSPALDAWGLRWEVGGRLYMPLLLQER